jgi:phenylpropionate dioxygenase-like ring-hydroxylating dioxygenase large terminal subunit
MWRQRERVIATGASAAPLREAWYFALPGRRLKPGRTIAKRLLGEPLLLGRDHRGAVFALRDVCPHRGVPLSCGRFDGRQLECCYHGWRFATTGLCTAIPSLAAGQHLDVSRIRVPAYRACEVQDNIWIYFGGDPSGAPEIPHIPGIGEGGARLVETMRFPGPVDDVVTGLMDPAHGPFVHRSWWWRPRRSIHEKEKTFVPSPWGFTMLRHAPSRNSRAYKLLGGAPETTIEFRLPGIRIEHVRTADHALYSLTAVTPIDGQETEVNHLMYWTMPWLSALRPLLRPLVREFLRQDRDIVAKQQRVPPEDRPRLLIADADTQARWYYRLKAEYARARSEGRPFENPVRPRILRWRS